jgi:four helix bundle protein
MERDQEPAKDYQTFEDLEVYQLARDFGRAMYRVAEQLPEAEKFGLTSQIRRAAVSLTNNIAEAHGRYHFSTKSNSCSSRAARSKKSWMI